MTNREKYGEQILDILESTGMTFGVVDGKVCSCAEADCDKCCFHKASCAIGTAKWLKEEYIEPQVDWSKVAVDTPILVRSGIDEEWIKRHFAKYDKGLVYC